MRRLIILALTLSFLAFMALPAAAGLFEFSTGNPDGLIATASRPASAGKIEIEAADDFFAKAPITRITNASFTGLLPANFNVQQVVVEIYRVFPKDSDTIRTPDVTTRVNSPSDVAFDTRSGAGLSFTTNVLGTFTANNSVLNGIFNKNHIPSGQFTGGEGPVTGEEVTFNVTFTTPFNLPGDHYFFIPQVQLENGDFFWLSAAKPISGGTGPFAGDLQSWIRNADLDPDWSRVGTDITLQGPFNATFSLRGEVVPLPATLPLFGTGLLGLGLLGWRRKVRS